jgi:chaperonin GroES
MENVEIGAANDAATEAMTKFMARYARTDGAKIGSVILQVRGPRVLIKTLAPKDKSVGGVRIPDDAQREQQMGTVLAVGVHWDGKPLEFAVGDTLVYARFGGADFEVDGDPYLCVQYDEIVMRVFPIPDYVPWEDAAGVCVACGEPFGDAVGYDG